jgi:hypothetical protein
MVYLMVEIQIQNPGELGVAQSSLNLIEVQRENY